MNSCPTGKVSFETFAVADAAAQRPRRDSGHRHAYRCQRCHHFHLSGSINQKKTKLPNKGKTGGARRMRLDQRQLEGTEE